MTFVRFLMLLSLVVWVGGIIFFAFVAAPTLFTILSREMAGNVVQRCLGALHWIGIACGVVFLVCSLAETHGKVATLRNAAMIGMMALTLISQLGVARKMERLRHDMGVIDNVSVTDARRVDFNALHQWSTRLEVVALLLGLLAIYDVSRTVERVTEVPALSSAAR